MKRNYLRFGIVLLLALSLISGCTRAKSTGPEEPTATGSGAQAATQPSGAAATNTPSGSVQDNIAATTTAWAVQTATAAAAGSQETVTVATDTPEPTSASQEATPTPTQKPEETAAAATSTPTPKPESTQPVGQEKTHMVKAGENLFRIALSYGLSTQTLASYNKIANPNIVYVGQVLKIPATGEPSEPPSQSPGVHVVQSGENLFRIALKYNMTYTSLASANGLSYPYTIYVGQRLVIP
jgi:lysozyme